MSQGWSWQGFVVDADGKVYSYDLSDTGPRPYSDDDHFTAFDRVDGRLRR